MVPLNHTRRPTHRFRERGITLTELMVTVVILGVLLSISISTGIKEWRREKVNKVAIELAGWLENARRAALRTDGCNITINFGTLNEGGTLATASCLSKWPLVIYTQNNSIKYSITAPTATTTASPTLSFTPRGTRYPSSGNTEITIALSPDEGVTRCVAIQGLLGSIGLGKPSAGNCITDQRF